MITGEVKKTYEKVHQWVQGKVTGVRTIPWRSGKGVSIVLTVTMNENSKVTDDGNLDTGLLFLNDLADIYDQMGLKYQRNGSFVEIDESLIISKPINAFAYQGYYAKDGKVKSYPKIYKLFAANTKLDKAKANEIDQEAKDLSNKEKFDAEVTINNESKHWNSEPEPDPFDQTPNASSTDDDDLPDWMKYGNGQG